MSLTRLTRPQNGQTCCGLIFTSSGERLGELRCFLRILCITVVYIILKMNVFAVLDVSDNEEEQPRKQQSKGSADAKKATTAPAGANKAKATATNEKKADRGL